MAVEIEARGKDKAGNEDERGESGSDIGMKDGRKGGNGTQ